MNIHFILLKFNLIESVKEPNYNAWEKEQLAVDSVELT